MYASAITARYIGVVHDGYGVARAGDVEVVPGGVDWKELPRWFVMVVFFFVSDRSH